MPSTLESAPSCAPLPPTSAACVSSTSSIPTTRCCSMPMVSLRRRRAAAIMRHTPGLETSPPGRDTPDVGGTAAQSPRPWAGPSRAIARWVAAAAGARSGRGSGFGLRTMSAAAPPAAEPNAGPCSRSSEWREGFFISGASAACASARFAVLARTCPPPPRRAAPRTGRSCRCLGPRRHSSRRAAHADTASRDKNTEKRDRNPVSSRITAAALP